MKSKKQETLLREVHKQDIGYFLYGELSVFNFYVNEMMMKIIIFQWN